MHDVGIGVDFRGAARSRAQNNWETPSVIDTLTPNILVIPNILDKSTPVDVGVDNRGYLEREGWLKFG